MSTVRHLKFDFDAVRKGRIMKFLRVFSSVVLFSSLSFAQTEISPASVPGHSFGAVGSQNAWITGKVVLEGGSAPPGRVDVVLRCGSEERARVSSDSKGEFTMMLSEQNQPANTDASGNPLAAARVAATLDGCEISADSPEYISPALRLFGHTQQEISQVGTLVLRPRSPSEGSTVSATTLAAPDKAKSAFAKGQQQAQKGKWAGACDYFRKAIQVYPKYALAWLELGRAEVEQNDLVDAQQSFQQAATQDSRLMAAYSESARVALQQQQWKELADSTQRLIELSPNASADAWFLNSAANFNLGDEERAEKSATRGLNLDEKHRVPQLEYLYAMIMARRGAYSAAVQHLQTYLRLSPKATDASAASSRLEELQKLVDSTSTAQR
jgi:Tfp pilus assembly protein PilF